MMRLVAVLILLVLAQACMANPFINDIDDVIDYSPGPSQWDDDGDPIPFHDPSLACGRPHGIGRSVADHSSVVTLGDGGSITLKFDEPVVDDPDNPGDYDFIVFSNCIVIGGQLHRRWQELAFVEISPDGTNWYLLNPSKPVSQLIGASETGTELTQDTGHSQTVVRNYAEYTPTMGLPATRTPEEFYCVPDRQSAAGDPALLNIDAVSGGGDAFDIASAVKQLSPGIPLTDGFGPVPAGITQFQWIRITDALVGDYELEVNEISAEIDAVADVRPAETVGKAKIKDDGGFTVIKDAVVTGVYPVGYPNPSEIYIEEEDRSAVIRLQNTSMVAVSVGDTVIVTGHLGTVSGERIITDPLLTVLSSGQDAKPVGMSNRSALTNPARLVKVWGQVKTSDSDSFTIEDGTGPLKVWCGMLSQPPQDAYVAVTGVVGLVNDEMAVKVRTDADITIIKTNP